MVQLDREPLLSWKPKVPKSHGPVDYFVPNFGKDHDIKASQTHEGNAESELKHEWTPVKDEKTEKWIVPTSSVDFRLNDEDSMRSAFDKDSGFGFEAFGALVQIDAEREPLLTWAPAPPKNHPINYFVPNFGSDSDMISTSNHLNGAEARLNHKWVVVPDSEKPAPHPVDYFVPNFGVDSDIGTSDNSLSLAEKKLGHKWEVKEAPPAYPMNYKVPSFGVDPDIIDTLHHIELAESQIDGTAAPETKKDHGAATDKIAEETLDWLPTFRDDSGKVDDADAERAKGGKKGDNFVPPELAA